MARPSARRHYSVDGQDVSLEEILQRTKLARGTIRGRLDKGMRTWASLGEDPARARKRTQDNLRRIMSAENQLRQDDKRKREAHQQLVDAKMPRSRNGKSSPP